MGAIYLGKKLGVGGFEKEVVLKQLLPEFTQQPKFIDLFLREARLSASLEHANIVHTIDLVNAGDDYFMVMEYVKGADLRTLLKRVRRKHKRFSAACGRLHRPRDPGGARLRAPEIGARRAPAEPDPSRHLALEHPAVGRRRGEAHRLRHRQGLDAPLGLLQGQGQGRLHVARAGARRAGRCAQRSVLARRGALRGARRRAAVRRRHHVVGVADLRPADPAAVAQAARDSRPIWTR